MRYGLCSDYLAKLKVGDRVNCFFRRYKIISHLSQDHILLHLTKSTANQSFICRSK